MASESLWVFAEQRKGKLLKVSREVLSEGRRLANKWNKELVAVLLGHRLEGLINDIAEHGADKVLLVQNSTIEENGALSPPWIHLFIS
jgi:electron transfer flavoprotein alpha subunit